MKFSGEAKRILMCSIPLYVKKIEKRRGYRENFVYGIPPIYSQIGIIRRWNFFV